ncbi:aquaporin-9 [Hydra vulgaris]|uniref:aquaporin-9 n=1 Tax=Hydra vulgaris TaxID=6087 RepID=UPI0002B44434|nr:aquaporin-9 [Hydra vulgaris]
MDPLLQTNSKITRRFQTRWKISCFCTKKISSPYIREFLAETMGTFILLMFGVGSIAQVVLGKGKFGGILSINFGWAIGVMFGIYWSAGVSGGHLNPAVTLAMAVTKRLPWKKLPVYWIAQSLGAFIASAVIYGVYYDMLNEYDGGVRKVDTAWIWTTRPSSGVSTVTTFVDQFVSSGLLVGIIFALTDKRNNAPSPRVLPLCVGIVVLGIGISFGLNCGYGINPARNLIPRLFTSIAGWKSAPLSYQNYYFWAPILAQLVGGVSGALLYIVTIEMHHNSKKEGQVILKEQKNRLTEQPV